MKITIGKCPFDIERLEREVNILFISDLHYDKEKNADLKNPQATLLNNLLVESTYDAGQGWKPDILIVGGDLVNKGNEENYEFYFDLINKLIRVYPNLRYTIYSTPGNHDVSRTDIMTMLPLIRELHGSKTKKSNTVNYMVGMFSTLSKKHITDTPLRKTFIRFEQLYFKTYLAMRARLEMDYDIPPMEVNYPVKGLYTTYFTAILGVNLVCHNSSFFCALGQTDEDRNNLFMIRDLLVKVNNALPKTGPVITFMHHPYHFLHESEYIAPLLASKDYKYNNFSKILESSDLVLSGHVHGDLQDPTYQQHHAYLITNGTSFTTEKLEKEKCYPFTYALLKVNKQGNWFAMKKFIYDPKFKRYKCKPPMDPPHYHFNHRAGSGLVNDTSLESEKLRVLDYFMRLYNGSVSERQNIFFVYQLGLYDEAFKLTKDKEFVFEEKQSLGCAAVLITRGNGSVAWVYKIESLGYPVIKELLDHAVEKSIPDQATVYFSIARPIVLLENGEPNIQRIDSLWTDFRSLVLLSKKKHLSINILYH